MCREGSLHGERGAVVETDHPHRQVFDRVRFVIPVGPHGNRIAGPVSQVGVGAPEGAYGLGRAHEIVGRLDHVHTDIDQRASALKVFAAEDTPVRNPAAAEGQASTVQDFPELPPVDEALEHPGLGREPVLETDHQDAVRVPACLYHFRGFLRRDGHGFLHEDILAGPQRVDGRFAMDAVRRAHGDCVDRIHLQQFPVVLETVGNAVRFPAGIQGGAADVGDCRQFHVVHCGQVLHVFAGDAAPTDETDLRFRHTNVLSSCCGSLCCGPRLPMNRHDRFAEEQADTGN